MKLIFAVLLSVYILSSCRQEKKIIVDTVYADSLLSKYTPSSIQQSNDTDLEFWKNRIDPENTGITNESKYAASLAARFNWSGDINDLVMADSVLKRTDLAYGHKEAGPILSLFRNALLQHRFAEADSLLREAKQTGIKQYDSFASSFDIDLELGRTASAKADLRNMAADYGYFFRASKLAHYTGDIDSAIRAMKKAADLANDNIYLRQAALSNAADLTLHNGNLQKAYDLYRESISLSSSDLHSIMGIGWIALVHDKNDSLAVKIFEFVHGRTRSPDPLFKLAQTFMAKGQSNQAKRYAREFEKQVTQPVYGNMYNKYLVELYTGILNEPAKAELVAEKELLNRNTPQTCAWYAWALLSNNKIDKAYSVYQQHVSGKPLEALELYWMGKLMQRLKKGYNAQQFFKEALKNKYDLSPVYVADLKNTLEE